MLRGDLAILRAASTYAVGDVATYRHPVIGPVIHRIIDRDGERFIFQGDNNNREDSYRPRADELIGKLWIFLPRAGKVLQFLRQPPIFAALAALVIGTVTMSTGTHTLPSRRRRDSAAASGQPGRTVGLLNGALTAMLALGLAALGLAALAFSRPTTAVVAHELPFIQKGQFAYSAHAPQGLYDGAMARSGDPIFRMATDSVDATFTYTFEADQRADLSGTARLNAELSDGEGWRRTLPLGPETTFSGGTVTLAGRLSFAELQAVIDAFEAQTGVRRGSYRLTLAPEVAVRGTLAGARLEETFAPRLPFSLDGARLQPGGDSGSVDLAVEQPGSLSLERRAPATLSLWLVRLDVLTAQRLALVGLEVALVGGLLAGWRLARELRRDQAAAVCLRFGVLLVRGDAGGASTSGATELAGLEDLARIAERLGQPIVAVEAGSAAGYYVRDGAAAYWVRRHAAQPTTPGEV